MKMKVIVVPFRKTIDLEKLHMQASCLWNLSQLKQECSYRSRSIPNGTNNQASPRNAFCSKIYKLSFPKILFGFGYNNFSTLPHSSSSNQLTFSRSIHFFISSHRSRSNNKNCKNLLYQPTRSIKDHYRFYSKHTDNERGDQDDNTDVQDILKELHSDKKEQLEKDSNLKNILDEIRSDFQENYLSKDISSDSSSDSSASSDDETSCDHDEKQAAPSSVKNTQEGDYVYDYRYADDIEDFGFGAEEAEEEDKSEKIVPIPLTRGKDGVFDLDELLTFLDHLGAENVVTVDVPPEANYCDHMVVTSAKSKRHLQFINDEFLWVHKRKKGSQDVNLHIEGLNRSDWCAMDLGNIVLHVFYGDARDYYDIESLWTLGADNDPKCQQLQHDPLALSEEDLFWMDAAKMKEKGAGNEGTTKSEWEPGPVEGTSDRKLDEEAGWHDSRPRTPL